jgi:hypothetical protein
LDSEPESPDEGLVGASVQPTPARADRDIERVKRTSRVIAGVSVGVFLAALIAIICLLLLIVYIGGHDGS